MCVLLRAFVCVIERVYFSLCVHELVLFVCFCVRGFVCVFI